MDREGALARLKSEDFDLLVIGGGATGCGIAVDAASRGLRVALVERNDFAEGTSGRSTKLIHGGVRYLEKAVLRLDSEQFNLVREGLAERALLLANAPHLVHPLSFLVPLYKRREVPYAAAGLKLYDLLAGKMGIGASRLQGAGEAGRLFPALRKEGLKAAILYQDGQFNDARMAVALAATAAREGAVAVNHLEVVALRKKEGRLTGALAKDRLGGEEYSISAAGVINATGPFVDSILRLDEAEAAPIIRASSGIHIVLDRRFAPGDTAMMIPSTEDGRILFVIPWEGHLLVGTTDDPAGIEEHPPVTEDEIGYLLRHLGRYLREAPKTSDVLSAWSGLRPLVRQPGSGTTEGIARTHRIEMSRSGLLTVAGGKWTSYRRMAEDAVDRAVEEFALAPAGPCRTRRMKVVGSEMLRPDGASELRKDHGLEEKTALHLHRSYGDGAVEIASLAETGYGALLHPRHPYIEAEVIHGARSEMAMRAIDILARRTPLALLDLSAAEGAAPRVIELMAGEFGWSEERRKAEEKLIRERLRGAL